MYTLAGIADPVNGWGVAGDTRHTLDAIARYGQEPWFLLGDQDFATHILRTERLRAGTPLSAVTTELCRRTRHPQPDRADDRRSGGDPGRHPGGHGSSFRTTLSGAGRATTSWA